MPAAASADDDLAGARRVADGDEIDPHHLQLGGLHRPLVGGRARRQRLRRHGRLLVDRSDEPVDAAAVLRALADREDPRSHVTIRSSTTIPRSTSRPDLAGERHVRPDADRDDDEVGVERGAVREAQAAAPRRRPRARRSAPRGAPRPRARPSRRAGAPRRPGRAGAPSGGRRGGRRSWDSRGRRSRARPRGRAARRRSRRRGAPRRARAAIASQSAGSRKASTPGRSIPSSGGRADPSRCTGPRGRNASALPSSRTAAPAAGSRRCTALPRRTSMPRSAYHSSGRSWSSPRVRLTREQVRERDAVIGQLGLLAQRA